MVQKDKQVYIHVYLNTHIHFFENNFNKPGACPQPTRQYPIHETLKFHAQECTNTSLEILYGFLTFFMVQDLVVASMHAWTGYFMKISALIHEKYLPTRRKFG